MKESNHIEYSNFKGDFLLIEVPEKAIGFEIKDKESMPVALMVQVSVASFYPITIPEGDYTLLGASDDEKFPYEEIVEWAAPGYYNYMNPFSSDPKECFVGTRKDSFFSLLSHLKIEKRVIVLKKK